MKNLIGNVILSLVLGLSLSACTAELKDQNAMANDDWANEGKIIRKVINGKEVPQLELSYCLNRPEGVENVVYFYHVTTLETPEMISLNDGGREFRIEADLHVFKSVTSANGRIKNVKSLLVLPVTYTRSNDFDRTAREIVIRQKLQLTATSARMLSSELASNQHTEGEVLMAYQTSIDGPAYLEYATSIPGFDGDLSFQCKSVKYTFGE